LFSLPNISSYHHLLNIFLPKQNLIALVIFLLSDNKFSTQKKISSKLYFGSLNKVYLINNFYEKTFVNENNFSNNFNPKLTTKYILTTNNTHSLVSSLNNYSFKNIAMNLYLTKNLVSNLNSSKQTR
jgi:hypothetical protein